MPRLRPVLRGAVLLLLGCAACRSSKPATPDTTIVATVNGETVLLRDFDRELARELRSLGNEQPRAPEQLEPVRRSLLNTLIDQALLLQQARVINVTVTADEIERRVLRSSSDYEGEAFGAALDEGQLTRAEFAQRTAASLTIEKLFSEHVYPRVAVTEEEIRQYFDAHAGDYQEPEQVRAAQIVVKTADEAQRVLAQLRGGKKFDELARKHSLSADAAVGGDLGYFPRGVMPPEFDEAAFRMGAGQVSDVISSPYGYHLIKVLDQRAARTRTFAEAREQVESKLLREKRSRAEADFRKALRDKAQVQVNDAALALASGQLASSAAEKKP